MQDENRSDGNGRVPALTCSGCGLRYSSGAIARHPALAAGEDDPVAVADLVLAVASAEEVTRELGARR